MTTARRGASGGRASAAMAAGVAIARVGTPDELDVLRATHGGSVGPRDRAAAQPAARPGARWRVPAGGPARRAARSGSRSAGSAGRAACTSTRTRWACSPTVRGGGVGLALKLAQRALCLDTASPRCAGRSTRCCAPTRGSTWCASARGSVAFLPHCYGDRRDAFNTGDTTDRVEVSWRLDVPVGGAVGRRAGSTTSSTSRTDYHALRAADPDAACRGRVRRWARPSADAFARAASRARTAATPAT